LNRYNNQGCIGLTATELNSRDGNLLKEKTIVDNKMKKRHRLSTAL